MELGGLSADADVEAQYHPDMDHALEWCENVLLEEEDGTSIELVDFLQGVIAADRREARVADLADYFETSALKAGEVLAQRGDRADEVFIVRSGRLGAFLTYDDGYRLRLRSMTSGTVVGEPAFYAGGHRSADLIAETETEIYRIKLATLEELERTDHQLALMVHHLLGHSLVNKLFSATGIIESLR
jgi:SulP family sulfate permease